MFVKNNPISSTSDHEKQAFVNVVKYKCPISFNLQNATMAPEVLEKFLYLKCMSRQKSLFT